MHRLGYMGCALSKEIAEPITTEAVTGAGRPAKVTGNATFKGSAAITASSTTSAVQQAAIKTSATPTDTFGGLRKAEDTKLSPGLLQEDEIAISIPILQTVAAVVVSAEVLVAVGDILELVSAVPFPGVSVCVIDMHIIISIHRLIMPHAGFRHYIHTGQSFAV